MISKPSLALIVLPCLPVSSAYDGGAQRAETTKIVDNNRVPLRVPEKCSCTSERVVHPSARRSFLRSAIGMPALAAQLSIAPAHASDAKTKSRTKGYAVRHSDAEWYDLLSPQQYSILRKGGTERQRSSILNEEDRPGTYVCAGCRTALFASTAKFKSGTGWPSFASALDLDEGGRSAVEVEDVGAVQLALGGAEVRCQNCGGHLGDVFADGWKFAGTPAVKTGKRYCIDGAALIFQPESGEREVRGDRPPMNKVIQYEQPMYRTAAS